MNKEKKEPKNIKIPEQEQKEEIKLNFWKRIWISIKDFEKYQELAAENVRVAIGYLMKLVLIFMIIATVATIYQFQERTSNFFNSI